MAGAKAAKASQVLLLKTQSLDEQRFQELSTTFLDEERSERFRGVWRLLTAWGYKPG